VEKKPQKVASYTILTIRGTVYAGYDAALLTTGSANIVVDGGSIIVLYGCVFLADKASSVTARRYTSTTVLGTDAVTIDGGMLGIEEFQGMAEIEKVFPSVKKGQLIVENIVNASSIMPSDVSKIEGTSRDRMLLVLLAGGKEEEDTELSIPEGLLLATNAGIASVETLTINGGFEVYSDITISDSQTKTLEVTGEFMVGSGATLTVENAVEIASPGSVMLGYGGKLKTTADGTVKFGKTTFSGADEWTAAASGDDAVSTSVSIVSYEQGALVVFNPSGTSTTGFLAAFSGKPVITQGTGLNNELAIGQNTVIHLQGTASEQARRIVLKSGAYPGCLTFYYASSKVLADAGSGGTKDSYLYNLTIGGKAVEVNSDYSTDFWRDSSNKLVQLGGTTAGMIKASTMTSEDVKIDSTVEID
jgi:hypothetical protein